MIQRARFQNFKSLRDVSIEFDSRLTVLVGPNGSGKTSVLQAIQFALHLVRQKAIPGEFTIDRLPRYASSWVSWEHMRLVVAGHRHGASYEVRLSELTATGWVGAAAITREVGQNQFPFNVHRSVHGLQHAPSFSQGVLSDSDASAFDTSAVFRFSPSRLAKPTLTRAQDYPPVVGDDGTGLAACLVYIQRKHPQRFAAIVEAFQRVIPSVRGLRFDEAPTGDGSSYLAPIVLVDFHGAEGIPADHLSSGTLFALGLLTVALGPDSPNVLLVDELDHGLHPKAQAELISVFRKLVDTNPDLQIVGTTHSLYILHQLEVNQIRLMNILPDGSATCGRLDKHPDYERWKDHMTPGEFWSHVGEDWLLKKAAPVAA